MHFFHCFVAQLFAGKVALRSLVAQNATKNWWSSFILHRHHSLSKLAAKKEATMSRRCKRLTENQWDTLISQWIDKVSQSSKRRRKSPPKRCQFVIDWCLNNGVPDDGIPHPSSVTRRLQLEEGKRQYISNKKKTKMSLLSHVWVLGR